MNSVLQRIKNGLIVSCQALEEEPLHGPILMAGMAYAAKKGGAVGIRANGANDVAVIKAITGLPVIGIEKQTGPNGEILITPTFESAERLIRAGADIIAFDACSAHPRQMPIPEFVARLKNELRCIVMADIGNIEDALAAERAGADLIASTYGWVYDETREKMDWTLIRALTSQLHTPVIAEGGIWSPEEACMALDLGVYAVVVGSAITRPQVITKRYADAIRARVSSGCEE